MNHGIFVLNLDRCTGCAACVVACNNENDVAEDLSWRQIHSFNQQRLANAPVFHFTLACNHCREPACLHNCPANAYTKDRATGAVLLDQDLCIGCRYCSWVCPYEAPQFNAASGVMEKCTFCQHRLEEGRAPACVTACPMEALDFERTSEPVVVEHAGFPETGLQPAIRIEGTRRHTAPVMTAAPFSMNVVSPAIKNGWSGLKSEWSLWIFTSIATLLVAWFAAATAKGSQIALPVFATAGLLAMGVSALHLGRVTRIWRAVLNLRRSWVSREVVLFSFFFTGACAIALRSGISDWVPWAITGVGFAAMFAMDMVYRVRGQPTVTVPHSAMAILTVAFYIGILTVNPVLLWPAATVKLVFYLARRERPTPGGAFLAPVRIGIGLLPAFALAASSEVPLAVVFVGAVIGESIDRAEFYASLRFLTPTIQIDQDLAQQSVLAGQGLKGLSA